MTEQPQTFSEAEAVLAASLPTYESRPQQQDLARFIEEGIASLDVEDGPLTHLLAEAGCGTGKSFGYLIPSILSDRRVVVSTATKALQDQVARGDLPFLSENLGSDFTYALLKGRSNYLCLAALEDAETRVEISTRQQVKARMEADPPEAEFLFDHLAPGVFDGERQSLGFEVSDQDWRDLTVSSDECPGKSKCPFGESCYAEAAKSRAKLADVVVVNHAMYLLDLRLKIESGGFANMIGDHDVVVFDEGHELEEWATNTFTDRLTQAGIANTAREVVSVAHSMGGDDREAQRLEDEAVAATDALWRTLEPDDRGKLPVTAFREANLLDREAEFVRLHTALCAVRDFVVALPQVEARALNARRRRLESALFALVGGASNPGGGKLTRFITDPFDLSVRWAEVYETTRRRDKRVALCSAPIEVSRMLRPFLFEDGPLAVIVSATLCLGSAGFDFIAGRLGIDRFASLDVGTPFSYEDQALLFVPAAMTDPTPKNRDQWGAELRMLTKELVADSRGRALLLFTAISDMRSTYDALSPSLPYDCYMQGQAPSQELAERFKAEKDSVLFGTKTFFTGVDFQGEACSLVGISKLPFPSPDEPVFAARCEAIEARGGNPFADYTVPMMALSLKQAFGRLIRHRNDRGVVAILDSRLVNKGYGARIIGMLPDAPLVTDLSAVEDFFSEEAVPA